MKIAHIAPIHFNIPNGRGAAGRAAYNLQRALFGVGIRPTFFACKNSKAPGKIQYIFDKELNSTPEFLDANLMKRGNMILMHHAFAYAQKSKFEIMQSHFVDWALPLAAASPDVTSVIKITNIPTPFLKRMMEKLNNPKHMHFVALSKSQARFLPRSVKNVTVIPEPVDVKAVKPSWEKDDFFLFVGRLIELKHPDIALRACIQRNQKITVIGTPPSPHDMKNKGYFEKKVKPLLSHKNVTYLSYVDHDKIFDYFRKAKAFIFPTDGDKESIGTVFLEAAASGTPSIALKNVLTQEIIQHGKTGLLAKNEKDLADMLDKVSAIDPKECRKYAEENFSLQAVGEKYAALYKKLLAR